MLKKWLAGILLIMLVGYTGWNLYQTYSKKEVGIQEGQQAPDFSLKTLSGEKSSLQDAKGKKCCSIFGQLGVSRAVRKCLRWKSCKKSTPTNLRLLR